MTGTHVEADRFNEISSNKTTFRAVALGYKLNFSLLIVLEEEM